LLEICTSEAVEEKFLAKFAAGNCFIMTEVKCSPSLAKKLQ
jgi:hypothetical protein